MNARWIAVAACAAMLFGGVPAIASVTKTTITGVVWNLSGEVGPGVRYGFDYQGLFGAAGADLRGLQYTATFIVDDQTPGAILTKEPGSFSRVAGDFGHSPVKAALTIGAGLLDGIGDYGGEAYRSVQAFGLPINTVNQILVSANNVRPEDAEGFRQTVFLTDGVVSNTPFTQSPNLDVPISYLLAPADFNVGSLFVYRAGQSSNIFQQAILLIPKQITVEVVETSTAVPEPLSWTLMLFGFGAVGALRRRRVMTPQG